MKIAVVVLLALLIHGGTAPPQQSPVTAPRNSSRILTAPLGGTVVSVMVKAGEEVKEGQLLLRLHAGEFEDRASSVIKAFDRTPLATLDRGAAVIDRIPALTWKRIVTTDPQKLAAEQEYVSALLAHETAPTPATKRRLKLASRVRVEAETGIPHQDLFDALTRRQHEEAADIGWLRKQFENGGIRSPVNGKVAIFDLRRGDEVAPNGRLMLIEAAQ